MSKRDELLEAVVKGIQEKKGQDIVIVDLRKIEDTICSYMVICQGGSPMQLDAIVDSVEETSRKDVNLKPIGVEGEGYSDWVVVDYGDVMLHAFLPEARDYYQLETLWEDADIERISNLD